jgi:hypothetical protein
MRRTTFAETLRSDRVRLLTLVWQKAVLASHAGKFVRGSGQLMAYRLKSSLISHVVERDPEGVKVTDLRLLHRGIVGLAYRTQVRLHAPLDALAPAAREVVDSLLWQTWRDVAQPPAA